MPIKGWKTNQPSYGLWVGVYWNIFQSTSMCGSMPNPPSIYGRSSQKGEKKKGWKLGDPWEKRHQCHSNTRIQLAICLPEGNLPGNAGT